MEYLVRSRAIDHKPQALLVEKRVVIVWPVSASVPHAGDVVQVRCEAGQ